MGLTWEIGAGHAVDCRPPQAAGFHLPAAVAGRTRAVVQFDAAGDLDAAGREAAVGPVQERACREAARLPQRRDLDEKNAAAEAAYQKLLGLQVALDDVERRYADGQSWTGENAASLIAGLQEERRQRLALRDAQKTILERCRREAESARVVFEQHAGRVIDRAVGEVMQETLARRAQVLQALAKAAAPLIDEAATLDLAVGYLMKRLPLGVIVMPALSVCPLAPPAQPAPKGPPEVKPVESPPVVRPVEGAPIVPTIEAPPAGAPAAACPPEGERRRFRPGASIAPTSSLPGASLATVEEEGARDA